MIDNLKVKGKLHIVLTDEFGNLKHEDTVDNLVVTAGLGFIASRMAGTSSAVMSHMAIGTGTVAAAAGNTTLGTEVNRQALGSTTHSAATVVYVATFNPGAGTGAITEAGILNNSSGGTLLCRTIFAVVNKAAGDTLTINWTVTVAAA